MLMRRAYNVLGVALDFWKNSKIANSQDNARDQLKMRWVIYFRSYTVCGGDHSNISKTRCTLKEKEPTRSDL